MYIYHSPYRRELLYVNCSLFLLSLRAQNFSGQLDLQISQQIYRLRQREPGILHAAAQNIHLIARGVPEIRFAQIALVELRFVQLCALETCQLHLALGKHGAYDLVAV